MTIFEDNMNRWLKLSMEVISEWRNWSRYRGAISFIENEVPKMLAQIEADSETIERRHSSRAMVDAAPDLFAALEEIEQQLDYGRVDEALKIARAAIAEATGGAS